MSHQHLRASQETSLETRRNNKRRKMDWIRIVIIISMLISFLQAHKKCTRHIKWGHLIQTLNSMGTAISHNCAFDYDEASLCDPRQLLNTMDHTADSLAHIVKKAESMYMENPDPKMFIEALQHTHHSLSHCVSHSVGVENEFVSTCFNKLEDFLKKKFHSHCAWEIINSKVREILQRLEKRSVRRRR